MPLQPLESSGGQEAPGRGAVLRSEFLFRHGTTWLTAMLCLEVLLMAIFQTPSQRFDQIAFWDSGGELAIQDLMRRGYRPALDIGYLYRLLPLLLGRLWYGLAGLSPESFRVQMLACMMLSAWGQAQAAGIGKSGQAPGREHHAGQDLHAIRLRRESCQPVPKSPHEQWQQAVEVAEIQGGTVTPPHQVLYCQLASRVPESKLIESLGRTLEDRHQQDLEAQHCGQTDGLVADQELRSQHRTTSRRFLLSTALERFQRHLKPTF